MVRVGLTSKGLLPKFLRADWSRATVKKSIDNVNVKFDLLNLEIKVRIRAPTPLLAEQLSTDNKSGLGEG